MSETPQDQNTPPDATGQPVPATEDQGGTGVPPSGDAGAEAQETGGAHLAGDGSGETGAEVGSAVPADGADAGTQEGTGGSPMNPPQPGADADGFGGDAPDEEDGEPDVSGVGELPPNVRPGAVSGLDHAPLDGSGSTDTADDDEAAESGEAPQD